MILTTKSPSAFTHFYSFFDGQNKGMGDSIEGPVMDRFHKDGAGYQYLSLRNQHGAGKYIYIYAVGVLLISPCTSSQQ